MTAFVSKELLDEAVRFHGHLGPFLVLGLRMSLRAEKILGGKPEKCEVETTNAKPFLCAVDGIKVGIKCNSVTLQEGDALVAHFSILEGKTATIKVKKTLIEKYAAGPWERNEEYALEVLESSEDQLFE
jgi:formylmethanofuran dehydrogenase subunit E